MARRSSRPEAVYRPRRAPEVNVPSEHPLGDVAWLLAGVLGLALLGWWASILAADLVVGRIGLAKERELGQRYSGQHQAEKDGRTPLLQRLVASLAPPDLDRALLPSVSISKHSEPNAFALPGGHLVFTQALLDQAKSENELAFVAAHELGHYVHRDPLRVAGRLLLQFSLASVLGLGMADSSGAALFGGGQQVMALSYSRSVEEAADDFAAKAVAKRYGHLGGALDFFKRMDVGHQEGLSWLSSHPATAARIWRLEAWAQSQGLALDGPRKKIKYAQKGL